MQSTLSSLPTCAGFVYTRGHRRFESFCEDVMRYRCIGACVGPAGVGKTASARRYTKWDVLEPRYPRFSHTEKPPSEVASVRSAFYTPPSISQPRRMAAEIDQRRNLVSWFAAVAQREQSGAPTDDGLLQEEDGIDLVIVDESDWLKMPDFELLRSMHDREGFGLILIGLVGLEKKLARYDQLYSRVGFVHRYAPLDVSETREMVFEHAHKFGVALSYEAFSDEGGITALVRESRGNFRLLEKLLQQCERVLCINELPVVSARVVDAARKSLTFGEG
ncbi:MAG: AAA family ATPase [Rubrobacter sp.]|nr:AAA family ATPase [Rubrobacter sp.]